MGTLLSLFAYIVVYGVLIALVVWSDRRWYRRHPGAEERFAEIDEELSRQEGR